DSGLQLGMWMTSATLIAGWRWYRGIWRATWGVSAGWLLAAMILTTILCRSTGALLLLIIGLTVLAFTTVFNSRLAFVGLLLLCPIYMGVRVAGEWGWQLAVAAASLISE